MTQELKKEIIRLKKEMSRLHGLIETDPLTNLYNRYGFTKRTEGFLREIEWKLRHRQERRKIFIKDFSIIFADLDDFKLINDAYGHKAGDMVLKEVAVIFKNGVKEIDILGRWGGEEFVVGLVGVSKFLGFKIAERLRRKLSEHQFKFDRKIIKVTASFGVASALNCFQKLRSIDLYRLIEMADEAMYEAKKKFGKNFVVSYHKLKKK